MSTDYVPPNDLDRAIIAANESPAAAPEFYRQLGEGELSMLIPYHPEFEGERFKLENGMPCPFVTQLDENGQEVILLFSSEERAEEGMRNGKVPPKKYLIASMEAKQALQAIGGLGLPALINKSCAMPQMIIPPNLMLDIASGAVFRIEPPGETVERALNALPPENYPTKLIEPLRQKLRQHRNCRAAWIFEDRQKTAEAASGRDLEIFVLMDPPDEAILHEIRLIIGAAQSKEDRVGSDYVDDEDPAYIGQLFTAAEPFYLADDFARPRTQ